MARPRAAAAPLLLASLAGRTAAYPEFWASVSLGDFGSLRPGGDFGRMGIRRFEAHAPGACALSSNAPADGFDPEANYTITVSSDAEGGVGHISRASAGGFAEALLAPGVVFTRGVETSAEKTWTWSSPSADAASVAFYAVCATGYHGKAFVAQPLVLQRKGGALPACAGASDRSALAAPCRCGTSGPAFPACEAGQCCWTDFRCRPCSEPGPPPDVQPSVAIWLHALLMLGSWGALLPLGVLFARHRSEARDWFPWHRGLQSAGCLCQAAGAAAAVWHVQLQGAAQAEWADDGTSGDSIDFADASLLQDSVTWSGPAAEESSVGLLAPEAPVLAGEAPVLAAGAPLVFVYGQVKRSLFALCAVYFCYSLYCVWHEWRPRKEKDDEPEPDAVLSPDTPAEVYAVPQCIPLECRRDPLLDCHVIRFVTTFIMVGRHLADALDYNDPLGQELHAWGNAFVIPAFAFASGVFNASANSSTVYSIWFCATLAVMLSLLTHVVVAVALTDGPVSGVMVFVHRIRYYWYLPCLFAWRMTIFPLASAARAVKVPGILTFLAVFGICYAGRHFWMPMFYPSTLVFIWNRLFAFGPFFAAGALLPRQGWQHLISDIRLQVLGALYFSIWHLLLVTLPIFRHWNVTVCFEPGSCEYHDMGGHFPMAALYRPYSLAGMLTDLTIYASMLPVTLALVWLVGGAVAFAGPRLPAAVRFCGYCGAHTLFALVLHVPIVEVAKLAQVRVMAGEVPEWLRVPLLVLLTVQTVAVLTCNTTVTLLRALAAPFVSAVQLVPGHPGARNL